MANYKNFKIKVPKNLPQKVKEAIAQEVIDEVIKRSQIDNKDKNGRSFPGYSKEYKESFDFQFKRGGGVNLTLSGEMLESMEVVDVKDNGEITIGYDNADSDLKGKVDGNCSGSYGQSTGSYLKARNFLGIESDRLKKIIDKYKQVPEVVAENRAEMINKISSVSIKLNPMKSFIDELDEL